MITRRTLGRDALFLVASGASFTSSNGQNTPKTALLPWPDNLAVLAAQAQSRGEPLVLMASLPGCPWCELLRRNYLGPMRKEGVAAFEFMITERRLQLVDFQAQRVTPFALSEQLKIKITPTLLFFNAQGQEIAARIEGVASADFIGTIVNERLTSARDRIKAMR